MNDVDTAGAVSERRRRGKSQLVQGVVVSFGPELRGRTKGRPTPSCADPLATLSISYHTFHFNLDHLLALRPKLVSI